MYKIRAIIVIAISSVFIISCQKEGCTDITATNYDSKATKKNNSCTYSESPSPIDYRTNYTKQYYSIIDSIFKISKGFHKEIITNEIFELIPTNKSGIYNMSKLFGFPAVYGANILDVQSNGKFTILPTAIITHTTSTTYTTELFNGSGSFNGNLITFTLTSPNYIIKGTGAK